MNYEKKSIDGTEFIVFSPTDWGTFETNQKKNEALVSGIKQKIGTYSIDDVINKGVEFLGTTLGTKPASGTQSGTTAGTFQMAATSGTFDPNALLTQVQTMLGGVAEMVDKKLTETVGLLKTDMTKSKVVALADSRGMKIDDMFIKVEQGKSAEQILTDADKAQKSFLDRIGVKLNPQNPGVPGSKRDINVLNTDLKKAVDSGDVTAARKIRTKIAMLKMEGKA